MVEKNQETCECRRCLKERDARDASIRSGPSYNPSLSRAINFSTAASISVGICRVLKARHGVKLDRGVVRVVGPNTEQGCYLGEGKSTSSTFFKVCHRH